MGWIWYEQSDADQLMKDIKNNTGAFAPYLTKTKGDALYAAKGTSPDLKAYAKMDDLKLYATTDALKGYATTDALKGYATTDALKGYATTDALKGYAMKTDLPTIPSYVKDEASLKTWLDANKYQKAAEKFHYRRGDVNPRMNCNMQPHHFRRQAVQAVYQPTHVLAGDMLSQKVTHAVQTPSYIAVDNQGCLVYPRK